MGILTTEFPELPEFIKSDLCTEIMLVSFGSGKYGMICTDHIGLKHHYIYDPSISFSWTGGDLNSPEIRYYDNVIFTTFDYYDDNNILISKGMPRTELIERIDNYSVIGYSSSSTFLTALNDTKLVLSIAFILVISFIGFRKAFNWLSGCIKGA